MVVMGLVLGQSLIKVCPFYNLLWELIVVVNYFDRSLHVGSSDPTCVQNFRSVPLTVFEILRFKLKKTTRRIDFFPC